MVRAGFVKRHRGTIASGAAMAVAVSAVVVYAVTASGYKSHQADLNDGGVWVVNGTKGWSGRLNKPINQLDGVVPNEDGKTRMDIIQDGAAVATLNINALRGQSIETSKLETLDGGSAAIPNSGDVQMAGGTLASADAETGEVWAVRYDARVGKPVMNVVDRQSDALAEAGESAALAVSQSGTVVVTSAEEATVTTVRAAGAGFGEPLTEDLPGDAGEVTSVTTVGERVVTLDRSAGVVRTIGGAAASVPIDSVLQQAGPASDSVLVATPDELLGVDLDSGEVATIAATTSTGDPVEPVRLGACTYGAWSGGQGSVSVQCGSQDATVSELGGDATNLAFRVNRGEIVLNDANSGAVWDVDDEKPVKIDNWEAFTSKKKTEEDDKKSDANDADRRPPQAKPDTYGVRAGRTTVLHPLDNDSAPEGRLLSIVGVDQPGGGARVEISPDGQTLVLEMPGGARPVAFDYYVDDGRSGVRANALVSVDVRDPGSNSAPTLRAGYRKPTYRVPHRGALAVPVLSDWRDDRDGDMLLLDSAVAVGGEQSGATARITADGRIRFTSPTTRTDREELVRVDFAVTDGRSGPVKRSMDFRVQAPLDQTSFAASAQPDVIRGEVGTPIKIRPLLNDLPGSDPTVANAELVLGGKVPLQPGATVVTDLDSGQVTFTGDRAGTYFLKYDAGFGNATLDQGTIRVDVKPRPKRASDPIAMPDQLTVYGQAPGIVDVLSNDLDPAGGLLVVQRAVPAREGSIDVAIIDGRWLRISSRQPDLAPATQTIAYTISNGASSAVRGEVVVTQRPAPQDNTPVTVADRVVVRAGTAVSAPVLDNDLSPSGDRLTLLSDLADGVPGELAVETPPDVKGDVGQAFVSGRLVRYVAPVRIKERDTFEVPYIAQNLDGQRAPGRLYVTVVPVEDPNDPPEPPTLEGRVVSGDVVKIRVPGVGVDRNGDPVTVTGITSAPRLGRIVSFGGNFLEYQAYPRTVGTDEFSYSVVDSQGAFATAAVRVAVVPPGQPQPPLAVEDRLTVEPGRTATFDPLANDFIAAGDDARVELLEAPEGVKLDEETNLVTLKAPASLDEPPVVVVYRVTNGLTESRATMTLETAQDFNNPPVVYDAFGRADESGSVLIDVLEGSYDPDGSADDLTVTDVYDPSATVVDGVQVRVNRAAAPQVLPFRVEDGDGAAASASVYVPPSGNGLPYVLPDAQIDLDSGESVTGRISDYIAAPSGAQVRVASGRRSYSASPTALNVGPDGDNRFQLTAAADFRGPGALLVEVTTATDAGGNDDTTTTEDGVTVLLSIPVQVGDETPVLECPSSVIPISAGQQYDLDIATFCKVFTLDPRDAAGLVYEASWTSDLEGLDLAAPQGAVVGISAAEDATQGGEAVLTVRAGESNTQQVRFRLAQAPPPTLLPIKVETMEAGTSRTYNLAPYLEAGVSRPTPTIVSIRSQGTSGVRATSSGSTLTLTADKDSRGVQASFTIAMSDIDSADPPGERLAEGRIQFEVVGTPSAPGAPRPFPQSQSETITMSWQQPSDDGGAPILYYNVEERRGAQQRCDTNTCVFRKLTNGSRYSFRVQAVNRVGPGEWSEESEQARADTAPGRVENIRLLDRGDGTITVGWDKPITQTSKILDYALTWAGGQQTVSGATSIAVQGLDNNATYVFTVKARNKVAYSAPRSGPEMQPLGTPAAPGQPTVTDLETGPNQTSLRVAWPATLPEGPGPTVYSVNFSNGAGSAAVPGCQKIAALECTHSGILYEGATFTYTVVAHNQPGKRSDPSPSVSFEAVGRPAQWAGWQYTPTGNDQEVQLAYTVPDSRGTTSRVDIIVNGLAVKSFNNQTGSNVTRVATPSNEQAFPVQLRVCNEKAPAGCTLSGSQNVQSYGRLDGMLNEIADPAVSGKNVTWTITGTSNGDAAQLVFQIDGGGEQTINLVGVGAFSHPITTTTAEFAQRTTLSVRLVDNAPAGRGEDANSDETLSGVPDPGLSASRGAACRDDDSDPQNNCWDNKIHPCEQVSCGFVTFTAQGFYEDFSCAVNNSDFPGRWTNTYSLRATNSGAVSVDTNWYYSSGTVTVTCTGTGLFGRVSTGSFTWP